MSETPPRIVVVGSLNLDLVTRVSRLPRAGETVRGESLAYLPGGKGANQAVAAARLGAETRMIGRVGDDGFGKTLLESLRTEGVNAESVFVTENCSSGVALIGVEDSGENAITILAGANGQLTPEDVRRCSDTIAAADMVLAQLEVPLETVVEAVTLARKHGVFSLLDPAPAPAAELPAELFTVDMLTPNQTEAEMLTGITVHDAESATAAANALHDRGAQRVVITLGENGAYFSEQNGPTFHQGGFSITATDTTAAGDAFAAGLAVAWQQHSPDEAVQFACAVGALATTRHGAQPAMPTLQETREFLRQA